MDPGATDCAGISGISAPRGQRGEKVRSEISSSFSYGQKQLCYMYMRECVGTP